MKKWSLMVKQNTYLKTFPKLPQPSLEPIQIHGGSEKVMLSSAHYKHEYSVFITKFSKKNGLSRLFKKKKISSIKCISTTFFFLNTFPAWTSYMLWIAELTPTKPHHNKIALHFIDHRCVCLSKKKVIKKFNTQRPHYRWSNFCFPSALLLCK